MRPVIASSESMAPMRLVMIQIRIPSPTEREDGDAGQRRSRPACSRGQAARRRRESSVLRWFPSLHSLRGRLLGED